MNPWKKSIDLLRGIQNFLRMVKSRFFQRITIKSFAICFNSGMILIKESVGQILGIFIENLFGYLHSGKSRPALLIGADSYESGLLGFGFSLPNPPSSKESLVQLDEAGELITPVSVRHRRSDFVSHRPNRLVGANSQESLRLNHRNAVLVAAHKKDKPKPGFKRHVGFVEDSTGRQRDLGSAVFTLIESARFVQTRSRRLAARTHKPLGPTLAFQMFAT